MIIKTLIDKQDEISDKDYINKPVLNHFSHDIDFLKNTISGHDDSKVIGVITDALTIEDKVELTITLWAQASQLQGEYVKEFKTPLQPVSFSIGFKNKDV